MALDRTQHQSADEIRKARELSLEPTRPPSQIAGYKFQRYLGSGAFGEVWSASDLKTGRRVAIKFYTGRSANDVKLLAGEVEKLVVLAADRYVVQLLDVGWDADPPYYVMDFIEHGSLEDRLREHSTMPTGSAVELFQELANGMMHLHDRGILHCDLKPGNVLLDQDGKPRVADFGQSRLNTEETAALGTLFYMAPEQANLEAAPDARWDVYGLGALLYRMLTGSPPYHSKELWDRIDAKPDIHDRLETYRNALVTASRPMAHREVPGVDRSLAEIIDRCIAADPRKRFANIQSVLLALRQRELAKARRPLMVLGLIGPLLLVSVMTVFAWWAFRQSVIRTQSEITKKSKESNQFASQLAARSAADQIDEYFRVAYQLSQDKKFLQAFDDVIADPQLLPLRMALADPHQNSHDQVESSEAIGTLRNEMKAAAVRKKLQPFLEERLFNRTMEYPLAASWFVCDRFGNQIASAFRKENRTLGNNYSYRSYFAGTPSDLKEETSDGTTYLVDKNPQLRQIIERPHLSAVFLSEQSNRWKIAFSTPVVRKNEIAGIVAVTVDLGNLIEFENFKRHYAMLVDTRAGENQGVILEHPLFAKVRKDFGTIPNELIRCRIEMDQLETQDDELFNDPVGGTKIGKASRYDQQSIVAKSPVTMEVRDALFQFDKGSTSEMPADDAQEADPPLRRNTGLVVLTVKDYASIVSPANELSQQLGRLALAAGLVLLLVTVGMWLLVRKMLLESRQRLERSFSPTIDSTSMRSRETITDIGRTSPGNTIVSND